MSNLVDHARRELELCGQFKEDPEFAESIVKAVEGFASYGHSGGSAGVGIMMIHNLLQFKELSPLTDDPQEWMEVGSSVWQNVRGSGNFSDDGGKTYYHVDDENREIKHSIHKEEK